MNENRKIKHPFLVPSNFHDEFKMELLGKIDKYSKTNVKNYSILKYLKASVKYVAIITIAFAFGRYSDDIKLSKTETPELETIYNQVSEDNLIDFIIENDLINEI